MSMTPSCLNYADMENAVKKLLAATEKISGSFIL